jgi:uncharacterized membrane-anchored protein YjiN (DUF445 family)
MLEGMSDALELGRTGHDGVEKASMRRLMVMRWVASGLLALMAVAFVACGLAARRWPGIAPELAYPRAFAEAGMVGACADWFAVTALFRRPFGLPIPHTGLIPRNKARIGEALGGFIADNFLTQTVLEGKLRQLEVGRWGAAWLREPGHSANLAERLTRLLRELLSLVSPQTRRSLTAALASDLTSNLPAATLAAGVLRTLWVEDRSRALLDRGLDLVAKALADNEALIRGQIAGRTFRWAPKWLDRRIADKILKVVAEVVEDMRRPDHPWRAQASVAIEDFLERLDTDPVLRARIERLKRDLLAHPLILDQLDGLWSAAENWINPKTPEGRRRLTGMVCRLLAAAGDWLETRDDARDILNAWARLAAREVIAPRRHQIGAFVAEIMAGWDSRGIVEKLELQVGPDLQYIRINGTLVGGCVGLAIFCGARWLSF